MNTKRQKLFESISRLNQRNYKKQWEYQKNSPGIIGRKNERAKEFRRKNKELVFLRTNLYRLYGKAPSRKYIEENKKECKRAIIIMMKREPRSKWLI